MTRICESDGLPCMFTECAGTNTPQCVKCWGLA